MESVQENNKSPGEKAEKVEERTDSINKNSSPSTSSTSDTNSRVPYSWMVKDCHLYKEEFKDCKSFKDRFHQYFVAGTFRDCTQWKEDYDNCTRSTEQNDKEALQKVIDSERGRVRERLKAHYENDVWERRDKPPENWNAELPEQIKKEYEGTFLQLKAQEIKAGIINYEEFKADTTQLSSGTCTIL